MAKIENTTVYPLVTPNASDYVIGTDSSDENRTVSFSIADITAAGGLQDLQSVLTTGNTATEDINLTGNITVNGTVYPTTITAAGTAGIAGQLLSSTGTGIQWVDTSVIASNTLQEVTTAGNTTTDNIVMNGGDIDTTGGINMSGASQLLALSNSTDMQLAANCDITTAGDIILSDTSVLNFKATAVIDDFGGSTGTAGQILTVNGVGTGVEWSTGVPVASMPTLQEVLNAGNTATGIGMIFSGSSSTTFAVGSTINSFAPNIWQGTNSFLANGTLINTAGIALSGSLWDGATTGTASQVLTSTATGVAWADVSTVGVSSVNATSPVAAASPLTPITISPNSGAVLVRQNIYTGGSLIGCVPAGGTAHTFLQGDGTWATPTGAVTSVSVLASAASAGPGDAIKISPTTGIVRVQSNAFDGSDNVGHVPDSSAAAQTTTFLRADGTWAAPAGGTGGPPEWVNSVLVQNTKWSLANTGNYYINPDYTGNAASMMSADHGASSPAVSALADVDIPNNIIQANTTTTGCITGFPDHEICVVEYSFISSAAAVDLDLWNTGIGGGGVSHATPAASVTITALAATLYNGTFTLDPGGVQNILLPGKGVALTLRSNTAMVNEMMALKLWFKYTAVI